MDNQEYLADITKYLHKLILKSVKREKGIYIRAFRTFENTRLNQRVGDYTAKAIRQCYEDLANLCRILNQPMFEEDIEYLNERAKTIS